MERHDPDWEERLRSGPQAADALLAGMRPMVSQVIVRPFVEAYRLVADVLASEDVAAGETMLADDAEVKARALGLGHQYVAHDQFAFFC
jgi:glycerol-3-phosphate O-acyltransferase